MNDSPAKSQKNAIIALCGALLLSACGGGSDSSNTAVTPTPTPTATTDPVQSANAIVQQFLQIDLANLENYANPVLPAYYDNTVAAIDNTPADDPVNDSLATLGRVMFYDPSLSTDDTTSCASCHQQGLGFDDDTQFSTGVSTVPTDAHAMRLGNVRFFDGNDMFWDRRSASLEAQASVPILNPIEMGWEDNGGIAALINKMNGLAYYPALFEFVFGDGAITEDRIGRALAHFQRAMISSDSRWDQAYAQVFNADAPNRALNVDLAGFSASEQRGRALFMTNPGNGDGAGCARCHRPPTYALDGDSRSNGLDANETTIFKSPSLKSVGRSGFFMHDGRFTTLLEVVEHYDSGIQNGPALDNRLRQSNQPMRLNLSAEDRQALVDFLLTLNDDNLVADTKFSNPFIN